MTPEEYSKLNIGDRIIVYSPVNTKYIATIIGKDLTDNDYICLVNKGGWEITNTHIKQFNIDKKYLGRLGTFVSLPMVEYIQTNTTQTNTSNKNTSRKKNSWANFAYGRQVEIENQSRPPLNERPFEFL